MRWLLLLLALVATPAFAGSGSPIEGTPGTSACARFDGTGKLVAASGDCASGDTGGAGGDSIEINGVAGVNSDFRDEGEVSFVRCTGAGVPNAACVAAEDVIVFIDDGVTVTGWNLGASTATTPAADNNSTSVATSAFVKTEFDNAGGRSITATGVNVLDADAELYTRTWSFPFLASSIDAGNDVLVEEIGATFTPTRWACVADGGSGLTTIDISIEECNTNGAACASIGATSTLVAVNTTVADTAFTDTTLTAGNWMKLVFGTVTWTSKGTVTCTLRGTVND